MFGCVQAKTIPWHKPQVMQETANHQQHSKPPHRHKHRQHRRQPQATAHEEDAQVDVLGSAQCPLASSVGCSILVGRVRVQKPNISHSVSKAHIRHVNATRVKGGAQQQPKVDRRKGMKTSAVDHDSDHSTATSVTSASLDSVGASADIASDRSVSISSEPQVQDPCSAGSSHSQWHRHVLVQTHEGKLHGYQEHDDIASSRHEHNLGRVLTTVNHQLDDVAQPLGGYADASSCVSLTSTGHRQHSFSSSSSSSSTGTSTSSSDSIDHGLMLNTLLEQHALLTCTAQQGNTQSMHASSTYPWCQDGRMQSRAMSTAVQQHLQGIVVAAETVRHHKTNVLVVDSPAVDVQLLVYGNG